MVKYVLLLVGFIVLAAYARIYLSVSAEMTEQAMAQMGKGMSQQLNQEHIARNTGYNSAMTGLVVVTLICALRDAWKYVKGLSTAASIAACLSMLCFTGCWKPFEPVKLEAITTNEEAFLIPLVGDTEKQTNVKTEEYLTQKLVVAKQIRIPQQWVPTGYETVSWNGNWKDAAILIKVDKSPVTREWTADENTGTSNKNEAIWVMTSDQVEFSTGWTCTARIKGREEAVKFLYNYPNGSLKEVMDKEIRARLQADWTLEVTDLPMEELRKKATPHIQKVMDDVKKFFESRGIEITNLGITGGFVYKDTKIRDTITEVFNAEQKKSIARASAVAQEETNKQVNLEAEGKAQALIKQKKAEVEGIKMVADAKSYELEKAQANQSVYLGLKRMELEKEKLTRWDGRFPNTFMGSQSPDILLQVPSMDVLAPQQAVPAKAK